MKSIVLLIFSIFMWGCTTFGTGCPFPTEAVTASPSPQPDRNGSAPCEPDDVCEAPSITNADYIEEALSDLYPAGALARGIDAQVVVWLFIDESGAVGNTEIARSADRYAFDQVALELARQTEFTPATVNGEPVPVWITLPFNFCAT